jgi:Uma2 family endonuclease
LFGSVPRLLTAADLAVLPSELPSGLVKYELHHGVLVIMTPPGGIHGLIQARFAGTLLSQGEDAGHGRAGGEVGIIVAHNPDHVLGADAVFIANNRLPLRLSSEGYLETIPNLIVEVRSKNDTLAGLARKAEEYLTAGAQVVWVADPINRNVIEYRPEVEPRIYTEDETLTVEDIIPGFQLSVRRALQD